MPELTYNWVVMSLAIAMFVAMFFKSFRCLGVLGFVFAWQCFTPVGPWYIDLPLMLVSIVVTEIVFRLVASKDET